MRQFGISGKIYASQLIIGEVEFGQFDILSQVYGGQLVEGQIHKGQERVLCQDDLGEAVVPQIQLDQISIVGQVYFVDPVVVEREFRQVSITSEIDDLQLVLIDNQLAEGSVLCDINHGQFQSTHGQTFLLLRLFKYELNVLRYFLVSPRGKKFHLSFDIDMAAKIFNFKLIPIHLLPPLLKIIKKLISNQPSNIVILLFLPAPTVVDRDDVVPHDDGTPAVSGEGADGVGEFGEGWVERYNAIAACHTVLVQDEPDTVFVQRGVVLTAARVPEYLQLSLIDVLGKKAFRAGYRQGRVRINLRPPILFWVVLQLDEGVVELQPLFAILAGPEFRWDAKRLCFVEGLGGAVGTDVDLESGILAFLHFVVEVVRSRQQQILGDANSASDSSLLQPIQEGHPGNAAVRGCGEYVWFCDGEEWLLVDELLLLEVAGRRGVSHQVQQLLFGKLILQTRQNRQDQSIII